jgi:hypothetical protein
MDYNKQPEGNVLPTLRGARHLSRFSVTDQTTNKFSGFMNLFLKRRERRTPFNFGNRLF